MKNFTCEQDQDDFEQEKKIKEWIESTKRAEFDYKYINSKGTARNTLIRASFSLDQKISEDGPGTFADLIKGSDGRDLFSGDDIDPEPIEFSDIMSACLKCLGFKKGEEKWLVKMLKLSGKINKWRFEKFLIDLE